MSHSKKGFGISNWAIDNHVTVYVITFVIIISGIAAYITMPREDFPEIIENKIYITSIFPGNSAEDVEKLITEPLEDRLKNISGIQKVTSTSYQDFSMITAEFSDEFTAAEFKQKVKDEVDLAVSETDWPLLSSGGKVEPTIFELNISEEVPILNINLKGNYTAQELKKYGETLEDKIEDVPEVKKVDILGVGDKEVEIAVDVYKMTAAGVGFDNISQAVKGENVTMSGGDLVNEGNRSNIRIVGEIKNPSDLENIIVKTVGGSVYLRDIATISFKEKERDTYARESGQEVVMLNVMKRSGQNMISAIDQIKEVVKEAQENDLPKDVTVELTGDQSSRVEHSVNELSNHIIFGIVLVMLVLMFAMGLRNSLFVGSAIPLSMLMAFAILSMFGYTLNTMVLFALVMGLGMLVDDGIVVVDNVYANMQKGLSRMKASKTGIGEIAWPVISSTATTVAAFVPLGLWPGTMGKFMIYFPKTLSIVLSASLFVALVINAAMTSSFMKLHDKNISHKQIRKWTVILLTAGIIFIPLGYYFDNRGLRAIGIISIISLILIWIYYLWLYKATQHFQHTFFPNMEIKYSKLLHRVLHGNNPKYALIIIFILFIFSIFIFGVFPRKVLFFPDNIPNQNMVYIEYPQGTDISTTNETTKQVEKQVEEVLKKYSDNENTDYLVESVVTQVGQGAGNPNVDAGNKSNTPYKGKVTVNFKEFKFRKGVNTKEVLDSIRANIRAVPGATVTVEKEQNGPPSGYPISLEISGDDYNEMLNTSKNIINFINEKNIAGIEKLQVDVNKDNPEIKVDVDRVSAGNLNTSTGMVGYTLRRSIYGEEVSTYKEGDDDYDITMRLQKDQRENGDVLMNQSMTYRNQATGELLQVPISTVASTEQTKTFNQIKRKGYKRIMTIYSNVLSGYNGTEITQQINDAMQSYQMPEGITYKFSGEQEEQSKQMNFLLFALFLALAGVTTIIVLQFNSLSKTLIIMATVLLSFSGVFYGLTFFNMEFVILMTMMGIISLAGVVVKNGIVLMDFFVLLLADKKKEYNVKHDYQLPLDVTREVIIDAGKSRLRPVILTATTAVLGLLPLAFGINFDFFTLVTDLNPHLYIGGDNVVFWAPLAWAIIFGLTYATALTLVMVPVMFYLVTQWKTKRHLKKSAAKAKKDIDKPEKESKDISEIDDDVFH